MHKAERKTLIRFLLLYAGSLALFLGILGYGYHRVHSAEIHKQQQNELRLVAFNAGRMLRAGVRPPEGVEWALLDERGRKLAGDFDLPVVPRCDKTQGNERFLVDGGYRYLIRELSPRADAAALSVRSPVNAAAFEQLKWNMVLIGTGAFVFFMAIAAFLSHLFLRPLRQTIELLDRFIKDTTHELTTPISAILMSIEGINKASLDERDQKRLDRIAVAARTLKVVYDDLAHVTLNARERRTVAELDLAGLVRQRIEFLEPAGRVRNIRWVFEPQGYEPPVADGREMARILDNLFSNAIKYNRTGGSITVTLAGRRLCVIDEGPGIAAADRKRIFERFTRLEESRGGFGLGLGIVKELCERNGFKIEVEEKRGEGSCFCVSW